MEALYINSSPGLCSDFGDVAQKCFLGLMEQLSKSVHETILCTQISCRPEVSGAGQGIASIDDRMEIDEKGISLGNISFVLLVNAWWLHIYGIQCDNLIHIYNV